MYVCMYVCITLYMYVCTYVCMYVCMYVCREERHMEQTGFLKEEIRKLQRDRCVHSYITYKACRRCR